MANPFYVSPLGGVNLGDVANNAFQMQANRRAEGRADKQLGMQQQRLDMQQQQMQAQQQQQQAAAARQQQLQELATKAQSGDLQASKQLYAMDPKMGAAIDQAMGIRDEAQAKQVGGWLEQYMATPADKREEFLQKTASSTPFTADDDLLAMDPVKRDQYANLLAGRYLNEEQINQLGLEPEEKMTPYQQEQVRLKEETLDVRRLENEERALDRQIKRETNELKRQELESKLETNQAKQAQAKRDTVAQQEASIARFDNALNTIKKIEASPGFDAAVGARVPFLDQLPGSDAQETIGLIDTLKSQSFLNEIQQMKGMGALSNAEGAKLETAISSLNRNMKEEAFKRSLNDIRDYFTVAKERAQKQMGIEPQQAEMSEADIMAKYGL